MISLPSALMRQFEERGPIDGPSVPTNAPYVLGIDLNRSESNRLLITQSFSPLGVPNRRSQRTLENKSFFAASVPTRTEGDERGGRENPGGRECRNPHFGKV